MEIYWHVKFGSYIGKYSEKWMICGNKLKRMSGDSRNMK